MWDCSDLPEAYRESHLFCVFQASAGSVKDKTREEEAKKKIVSRFIHFAFPVSSKCDIFSCWYLHLFTGYYSLFTP